MIPQRFVRRRNLDQPGWTSLPASGRPGDPPPWPDGMRCPTGAQEIWANLWAMPQAIMWDGFDRFVGRYVLTLLMAEEPMATASILSEVRQMEDKLGLSPKAMEQLRWKIVDDAPSSDGEDDDVDDYLV